MPDIDYDRDGLELIVMGSKEGVGCVRLTQNDGDTLQSVFWWPDDDNIDDFEKFVDVANKCLEALREQKKREEA